MSIITYGRWSVIEGIPGIASKGDIVIVRPDWGIIVSRYLSLAKYPDLMLHRDALLALRHRRPVPPIHHDTKLELLD